MDVNIILLIAAILILLGGAIRGFQNGFVAEVSNMISLLAALIVVAIFVVGIKEYMQDQMVHVIVLIIALLLIVTVYKVVNFILTSFKIIMKLPVASGVNRMMGFVLGTAKGLIVIWLFFIIMTYYSFGNINQIILTAIYGNQFLNFLFENNLLIYGITRLWDLPTQF